jgi:hypothetical protein
MGFDLPEESYEFRSTEEGLANLHSYLDEPEPFMRKTFLTYVGAYLSQTESFRTVYVELTKLGVSNELAWSITTRSKRGMTDTSQAGGFTKDKTYLEGAVAVWKWLMDAKHDVHDLYAGRISLDQVNAIKQKLSSMSQPPKLHFPEFIADQTQYLTHINQIGTTNQFDKLIS